MTDHLAAELRGILDDLHDAEHGDVPKPLIRERLERLAEHVERLGTEPEQANPLADDIRRIADHYDADPSAGHRYVNQLADHVERLADPVEVDASTELTANFGLEPDQEIRDRGLERAVALLAPVAGEVPEVLSQLWSVADEYAAYIRTGERP